ncbi:MAG: AtpZ/AtpI family protein [Gemmatimonadales bacterium]
MAPQDPKDERARDARSYGQGYAYFGVALSFALAILSFGAIGWVVDGWLHTRPVFAIAGGFVGGTAGFLSIYYRVKRDSERGTRDR